MWWTKQNRCHWPLTFARPRSVMRSSRLLSRTCADTARAWHTAHSPPSRRECLHNGQQEVLFGAGAMRLRVDDDLMRRIDGDHTRVAVAHPFVRRHLRAVVVRTMARAQTASRAAAVGRMREQPLSKLLRIRVYRATRTRRVSRSDTWTRCSAASRHQSLTSRARSVLGRRRPRHRREQLREVVAEGTHKEGDGRECARSTSCLSG